MDGRALDGRVRPGAAVQGAHLDCTQSRDWGDGSGHRNPTAKMAWVSAIMVASVDGTLRLGHAWIQSSRHNRRSGIAPADPDLVIRAHFRQWHVDLSRRRLAASESWTAQPLVDIFEP